MERKIDEIGNDIAKPAISEGTPDITIDSTPEIDLRRIASEYDVSLCSLLSLYKRYRGRRTRTGAITMEHVIGAVSITEEDVDRSIEILEENDYEAPDKDDILQYVNEPIIIVGTPVQRVDRYVAEKISKITLQNMKEVYTDLMRKMTVRKKLISMEAVIGGIVYFLTNPPNSYGFPRAYDNIVNHLERENSPLHMSRTNTLNALSWYGRQVRNISIYSDFYESSFNTIVGDKIGDVYTYPPEEDFRKVIIHPLERISPLQLVSRLTTSPTIPFCGVDDDGEVYFKRYAGFDINPSWMVELRPNSLLIYVSLDTEKYRKIVYNSGKGYFTATVDDKTISMYMLSNILCKHFSTPMSVPEVKSSTYSFITNYINLDKDIMAYILMNPIGDTLQEAGTERYLYVRENTKPNSLKTQLSIHIDMSVTEMYLSFSDVLSESRAIVEEDDRYIGFMRGTELMRVKINKCPNIYYARMCRDIYSSLVQEYIDRYDEYWRILGESGYELPYLEPDPTVPEERDPSLREIYMQIDPILYNRTSNLLMHQLPVPISREDVQDAMESGYMVLKLPLHVRNNNRIHTPTLGTRWVRTPYPNKNFVLYYKGDGYIPIVDAARESGIVKITPPDDDWAVRERLSMEYTSYILKVNATLRDSLGRYAHISEACKGFLNEAIDGHNIMRKGISGDIIHTMGIITGDRGTREEDVAEYAYICLRECWDQIIPQIKDDIKSGDIEWFRHWRALEEAYNINLYFLMDDGVSPTILKPRYRDFYVHRRGSKRPCAILYSQRGTDIYSFIVQHSGGRSPDVNTFDVVDYMDKKAIIHDNVVAVNPKRDLTVNVFSYSYPLDIGEYRPIEQVVDNFGKCRAITYTNRDRNRYFTIYVGYLSIQRGLTIGRIRVPTYDEDILRQYPNLRNYTLKPSYSNFEEWLEKERIMRMLRIIIHTAYSLSYMDLDMFMDTVQVYEDEFNIDDIYGELDHSFDSVDLSSSDDFLDDVMRIAPSITDGENIFVPDEETKEAMRLHLMAIGKVYVGSTLPQTIAYSWDMEKGENEYVYSGYESLANDLVRLSLQRRSSILLNTTEPFIMGEESRYLVQMVPSMGVAYTVVDEWESRKRNPGYDAWESEERYIDYVNPENLDPARISYTIWDGNIYVIIPIYVD